VVGGDGVGTPLVLMKYKYGIIGSALFIVSICQCRARTAFILFSLSRHKELREQELQSRKGGLHLIVFFIHASPSLHRRATMSNRLVPNGAACPKPERARWEAASARSKKKRHKQAMMVCKVSVPKRPMSVYLAFFSNQRRKTMKQEYPHFEQCPGLETAVASVKRRSGNDKGRISRRGAQTREK